MPNCYDGKSDTVAPDDTTHHRNELGAEKLQIWVELGPIERMRSEGIYGREGHDEEDGNRYEPSIFQATTGSE